MVKIKLKVGFSNGWQVGDIVEVTVKAAERYVSKDFAEYIGPVVVEPTMTKVITNPVTIAHTRKKK